MTAILVLSAVLLLLVLLVIGRWPAALLFTGWAVGFLLLGWCDVDRFLRGFANPALVTLVLLLLVSLALERSRIIEAIIKHMLNGSEFSAMLKLTGAAALMSSVLNNTAVVGTLLGPLSRQTQHPVGRLLMPLSYASILGGVTTLVGTSTNLVVDSLLRQAGMPGLQMFQFAWVGVPLLLACGATMLLMRRLLPANGSAQSRQHAPYFLEARVAEHSPLIGRSVEQNGLRGMQGLFLVEMVRDGHLLSPVRPTDLLEARDILLFSGSLDKVQELQRYPGLEIFGNDVDALFADNLLEVVIAHSSELEGKTLREVDFRLMFDAGVVAIRRGDRQLTGKLGQVELKVGDCLVLAAGHDFRQHRNVERNFHLLSSEPLRPRLNAKENLLTLGCFALVIACSAAGVFPLLNGLLVMLGILLAAGVLTRMEMRRRFPFDVWLLVGSALAVAGALEQSGAAKLIAGTLNGLFGHGGLMGSLFAVYLMTWLLTELITNNAAAALALPVGLEAAKAHGVDPMPFVMVVAYASSACFLIPSGYQTHLMVLSPGRYKTRDFIRFGLPILVVYSALVLWLTPIVFA
ncbi:SLC13 family permease [Methylomonas sp. HYX-M1]|uniref:SLC13 family permease n=1 Tax=Methylomonas sp. HYX-M1 TaxID=3139307 RepID=UPI00345BA883